ncbi:autotransporter domain-containing protein [Ochrobactrum cytisi]|nr:autotransporter domain-containing protein [Brucella cytisi]
MVTVGSGGAVAPGSALDANREVAALTVTGDFRQASGSIYQAGLAKSSDLIDVREAQPSTVAPEVELLRQGTPSVDTRYTLLSAVGLVNGTYGGLTGALATDSPFVDFALAYDARNVYLDTSRTTTSFTDVGATFNQRSVGAASQALGGGNPVYDNILFLTTPEARDAFNMLSGEIHASTHSALIEDSHFVRDAAADRIRAAFDGVGASSVSIMAYGPGGRNWLLQQATNSLSGAMGSGRGDISTVTVMLLALIVRPAVSLLVVTRLSVKTGGLACWLVTATHPSTSMIAHRPVQATITTSASTPAHSTAISVSDPALPIRHRIETERFVVVPGLSDSLSTNYDAGTFRAFGELGYRIDTVSASYEPYANLAYVNFDADGFTEKGGAAALSSGGSRATRLTPHSACAPRRN